VFVDAKVTESIDPGDHPDLSLAASSKRRDLRVSDQALVLRADGSLKVIDQMSRVGTLRARAQDLVYEQKLFEDIKGAEAQQLRSSLQGAMTGADYEGMEDFAGFAMGMGAGELPEGLQDMLRRGRGRNTLRKGGRTGPQPRGGDAR
jgi:hypothetical protein